MRTDLDFAHWREAGIEPFVALNRRGESLRFIGRDAPPPACSRRSAIFRVETSEAHAWSVPGDSPVLTANGDVIGFTTTSARGARTGETLALGYIRCSDDGAPLAAPHDPGLVVECYGNRWPLQVLEAPPFATPVKPKIEPQVEPRQLKEAVA